jgi:hypothetical protein
LDARLGVLVESIGYVMGVMQVRRRGEMELGWEMKGGGEEGWARWRSRVTILGLEERKRERAGRQVVV